MRSLLAGVLVLLWGASAAIADCRPDRVSVRGDWGQTLFFVELATTPQERAQGLMFRQEMPRSHGMLFLFDPPQSVSFWMKNTLIPLDMIFVDRQGVVQRVHSNAIPGDLTGIPGGDNIYAVLEINGGLSRTFGLDAGSQMQHPAFAGGPATWPC